MNPEHYHLEFFDEDGHMPVRAWLDRLEKADPTKHDALVYALQVILARQGPNVCDSEYGKNLGKGLYEFRIRHTRAEIQAKAEPYKKAAPSHGATPGVLLRLFFAVRGEKIVLLLGGYDKGADPKGRRQQAEIEIARAAFAGMSRSKKGTRRTPAAAGTTSRSRQRGRLVRRTCLRRIESLPTAASVWSRRRRKRNG
jgi:hypothetical protein